MEIQKSGTEPLFFHIFQVLSDVAAARARGQSRYMSSAAGIGIDAVAAGERYMACDLHLSIRCHHQVIHRQSIS
jgi:hypothetical protein